MHSTKRTSGARLLRVANRRALAEVVERLGRHELKWSTGPAPSVREIAGALRITKSTVHRIRVRELPHISQRTAAKLEALTMAQPHQDLRGLLVRSIVSQQGVKRLNAYKAWVAERTSRFAARRRGLRRHMAEKHVQIVERPIRTAYESDLRAFHEWAQKKGHEAHRIRLAIRRILEPFAESRLAGDIECAWDALSPEQQKQYMKRALQCEMILLSRLPAAQLSQAPPE